MMQFPMLAAALLLMQPAIALPLKAQTTGAVTAPASPEATAGQLWRLLHMTELLQIMQSEAELQSQDIALTMFGEPRDSFDRRVAEINDPARLTPILMEGFSRALADAQPALIEAAIDYLNSSVGQKAVRLEIEARRVLVDRDADLSARSDFYRAERSGAPRAQMIRDMLDGADLVEPNVAAALNATLAFSRGFDVGGGNYVPLNERQMMADIWAQEGDFRIEATEWLLGFMMYAYSPLTDDELRDYTAFSASPEGRALTVVLFQAFAPVIVTTSEQMGQAAAAQMRGRSL